MQTAFEITQELKQQLVGRYLPNFIAYYAEIKLFIHLTKDTYTTIDDAKGQTGN